MGMSTETLAERQKKWFASVKEGLARDTGKSLADWVAVARICPETSPRARLAWMKHHHGLGQNRASFVMSEAFPEANRIGEDVGAQRAALWTDPASAAILEALEKVVADLPGLITGQRKAFTVWSRGFQFAAAKLARGGVVMLGPAAAPDVSPRLIPPKNEGWSERLKAKLVLAAPSEVDEDLKGLLKAAWENS